MPMRPDLKTLTAAAFQPLQHDSFMVAPGETAAFAVELVEVAERARQDQARAPFSLIFRGGPDPPLPQRIYRVHHHELGALDLFLVPIGRDEVGQRYEAVFT
jgi:hypothetical protein